MFTNHFRTFTFTAACAILGSALVCGQSASDAASLPNTRGVFYKGGASWVTLPWTMLMPNTTGEVKAYFSVGRLEAEAAIPGSHALTQVGDAQPVFYVRGLASAMGPRLVRLGVKDDYRRLKMRRDDPFKPRSPFYDRDTHELEITQVSADTVAIRPKGNLSAGEYAVVTSAGPDLRRIFLGFDFRVR